MGLTTFSTISMWKMYVEIQISKTHCMILGDNDVVGSLQFNGERTSVWQFENISNLTGGLRTWLKELRAYAGYGMLLKLNF